MDVRKTDVKPNLKIDVTHRDIFITFQVYDFDFRIYKMMHTIKSLNVASTHREFS